MAKEHEREENSVLLFLAEKTKEIIEIQDFDGTVGSCGKLAKFLDENYAVDDTKRKIGDAEMKKLWELWSKYLFDNVLNEISKIESDRIVKKLEDLLMILKVMSRNSYIQSNLGINSSGYDDILMKVSQSSNLSIASKEHALNVLMNFWKNDENKQLFATNTKYQAFATTVLVELINSINNIGMIEISLSILINISNSANNREIIVNSLPTINEALIHVVVSSDEYTLKAKELALGVLKNLTAVNEETKIKLLQSNYKNLNNNDSHNILESMLKIIISGAATTASTKNQSMILIEKALSGITNLCAKSSKVQSLLFSENYKTQIMTIFLNILQNINNNVYSQTAIESTLNILQMLALPALNRLVFFESQFNPIGIRPTYDNNQDENQIGIIQLLINIINGKITSNLKAISNCLAILASLCSFTTNSGESQRLFACEYNIFVLIVPFLKEKIVEAAKLLWNACENSISEVKQKAIDAGIISILFQEDIFAVKQFRSAALALSFGDDICVNEMIKCKAVEKCQEYLNSVNAPNSKDDKTVNFLLANLIGKEEDISGKYSIPDCTIKIMTLMMAKISESDNLFATIKEINEVVTLKELLWPLEKLAINDSNQVRLANEEMVVSLRSVVSKKTITRDDKRSAMRILNHLVFVTSAHPYFADDYKAKSQLDSFSTIAANENEDGEVRQSASGILFGIKSTSKTSTTSTTTVKNKLMISYNWKYQTLAKQVKESLTNTYKFDVWIDIEQMHGDIMEAMASAVDGSNVVLVLVSTTYHDSANCKRELQYATKRNKNMIFLMVEPNYDGDGWLGLIIGDSLYIDFRNIVDSNGGSKNSDKFDLIMKELVKQIHFHIDPNNNDSAMPSDSTTTSASKSSEKETININREGNDNIIQKNNVMLNNIMQLLTTMQNQLDSIDKKSSAMDERISKMEENISLKLSLIENTIAFQQRRKSNNQIDTKQNSTTTPTTTTPKLASRSSSALSVKNN